MAHIPIEVRIARLAAKLSPDEAANLLRSWDYYKTQHSSDELEEMYASHCADRRERVRQELQRIYDLTEGGQ